MKGRSGNQIYSESDQASPATILSVAPLLIRKSNSTHRDLLNGRLIDVEKQGLPMVSMGCLHSVKYVYALYFARAHQDDLHIPERRAMGTNRIHIVEVIWGECRPTIARLLKRFFGLAETVAHGSIYR